MKRVNKFNLNNPNSKLIGIKLKRNTDAYITLQSVITSLKSFSDHENSAEIQLKALELLKEISEALLGIKVKET